MTYEITRKHTHECLNCNPTMIPDYNLHDPLIHFLAKCKVTYQVLDDGKSVGLTSGVTKEGKEGFYFFAGADTEDVHLHDCSNLFSNEEERNICLELRFGNITVVHDAITPKVS